MKGLFLDDERNVEDVTWRKYPDKVFWKVVRDRTSFCNADFRDIDYISLDHDLAIEDFTGYDAIKMYCEYVMVHYGPDKFRLPTVVVHSKNPVGKENIEKYWDNFCKVWWKD